ncbi:alpha/beta hydrolase [Paraburkholderia aspalathi]|nr:alpha/beta hydrolase [Paraburkholderia aspalathi]
MTIRKRLVVQFTGYENLHPKAVRGRHIQALNDFDKLWNVKSTATAMIAEPAGCGTMHVTSNGNGWSTQTEFCQFGTADVFDDYARRPMAFRLATGLRAFLNILLTGTLYRYLRTSWRFVLFFLWPFALSLALIALAGLTAALPAFLGLGAPHLLWSLPLAVLVIVALVRFPGEKLFFSYLLDDWSAAYDRIHDKNPTLVKRRGEFAAALATKLKNSDADEVILVAHSLGAVPGIEALAEIWRTQPDLLRQKPVSLLMLGSCLLMFALHPRAKSLREDIRVVMEQSPVNWIEYQALTDIIHFFGSNPAKSLSITPSQAPTIHYIRFKHVHGEKRYQRAKANFFRMHMLYLRGAQKKNAYDIGMFLHGPFPLAALTKPSNEKAAPLDEAGRLLPKQ